MYLACWRVEWRWFAMRKHKHDRNIHQMREWRVSRQRTMPWLHHRHPSVIDQSHLLRIIRVYFKCPSFHVLNYSISDARSTGECGRNMYAHCAGISMRNINFSENALRNGLWLRRYSHQHNQTNVQRYTTIIREKWRVGGDEWLEYRCHSSADTSDGAMWMICMCYEECAHPIASCYTREYFWPPILFIFQQQCEKANKKCSIQCWIYNMYFLLWQ